MDNLWYCHRCDAPKTRQDLREVDFHETCTYACRQCGEVEGIWFQAGGSKALQALVAGSTDAVVGFFDHTVQMQAQGKEVVGVILLNNVPGLVMGVRSDLPIGSGKDPPARLPTPLPAIM